MPTVSFCTFAVSCSVTALLAAEPLPVACDFLPAHCVAPQPMTVHRSASQSAVLPLPHPEEATCAPRASCIQPAAHRIQSPAPCVSSAPSLIHELLQRWEAASAHLPAQSPREREWLQRRFDGLSAHAIDVVLQLSHTVSRDALESGFAWTLTPGDNHIVQLQAQPRDDAVKLFCKELHIAFDTSKALPVSIEVIPRRLIQTVAVGTVSATTAVFEVEAELVGLDADLPPSPTPSVRFAAGSFNLEIGTRR